MQAFDDVERKEKPKEDPFEFKKRIVLDQEKSKMSLGELYEQEFLKQQQVRITIINMEVCKYDCCSEYYSLQSLYLFNIIPLNEFTC